jgi:cephalosporin-C deacetylase-like acetyl esterase
MMRLRIAVVFASVLTVRSLAATEAPPPPAFRVMEKTAPAGPRITPYLQYQADQAWREDEERRRVWAAIRNEDELRQMQQQLRQKLLKMIGGLPEVKTELHAQIVGKVQMAGFSIERLIFQSLPGVYVSALVYVPEDHASKHPAVLVPAGHAPDGKFHYQALSQRLVGRGYLVIAWDPVGQGERSQFWDAAARKSRYNLVCGEHSVLGNLAYLAGANLARWEIWDGIRAVDYLLSRPDVDPERISITGTSGGGTQTALIAALDPRIKVAVPSCYITALPMRVSNRIFADPDSDPEQDLFGMIAEGVDHPGLLLLMYPRPVMVAAAVLDFFPIEGARKSFREVRGLYERFGHADRVGMVEGYHAHQFSPENQEPALDFIDHFNGQPVRHGLAPVKELDAKTLQCTRTGQVIPDYSDARSLMDVIRDYYDERRNQGGRTLAREYYGARYPQIKEWRVSEYSGVSPAANEISWQVVGSYKGDGFAIDRYLVRHSRQLVMPLLFIHRSASERRPVLLWFRDWSKATAMDWPDLEKYLNSGYDIVSFDFRGLGETRMPYTAVSPDDPELGRLDFDHAYVNPLSSVFADYVYNSLLASRPYFLQMIEDAEIAGRFASEKLGMKVTAVTADGESYGLASAIAESLPGISLLPQANGKVFQWSEAVEQKREMWPIQYLLPYGAYVH